MAEEPSDLSVGSFSESAPWILDPDTVIWRTGLDIVRDETRRQVPLLVRRRVLPPGRRIVRVTITIGFAVARWWLSARRRGRPASRSTLARHLRVAFGRLGPTYIKLGQILSSGEGIFPPEIVAEFSHLRDRVPPESFAAVRTIIEADFGRPISEVFSEIDETPVAAASIAQVHRARLTTGEEVVVKVQRPRVAAQVREDLEVMSYLAPHLVGRIPIAVLANPPALIELFAETIVEELDFRLEAESMLEIAQVLASTGQRAVVVPRPHPVLVTPRVLVMERLHGFSWDDVSSMRAAGIETEAVLRALVVSFLEGAMLYGVFHGDLHGGNLLVRADGRVALLDFGITGRFDDLKRLAFMRLIIGGTTNDLDAQVEALKALGALPEDADTQAVIKDLGFDEAPKDIVAMSAEELTGELRDLTRQLLAYGARVPKELMLFVKDVLFLDGAVAAFSPDVDILGEIASIAAYFATRHGERISSEIGLDPRTRPVDLTGVRSSLGIGEETESLSHRELEARRAELRRKFQSPSSQSPSSEPPAPNAPNAPTPNAPTP